jgi:hypothetical protein
MSEAKKLIDSGYTDPRTLDIPYCFSDMTPAEFQVLEMTGKDPKDHVVLRLEVQRVMVGEDGTRSWFEVAALFPRILQVVQSKVLTADGGSASAAAFQDALGPCEFRICLRRDAFAEGVVLPENFPWDPDDPNGWPDEEE